MLLGWGTRGPRSIDPRPEGKRPVRADSNITDIRRLLERDTRSKPVLEELFNEALALDTGPTDSRGGRIQKAVTYLLYQRESLLAHLKHGDIPVHNNDTERDLRHLAVGRKNWTIFGSQRGGEVAARLYSLAISCQLNGVGVQAYLEELLRARWCDARLMPGLKIVAAARPDIVPISARTL